VNGNANVPIIDKPPNESDLPARKPLRWASFRQAFLPLSGI
jgi:hypothetical protein